jgi:hypothetical protein
VSVEERLVRYAQTVAHRLDGIDQDALLEKVSATIQAAEPEQGLVNCEPDGDQLTVEEATTSVNGEALVIPRFEDGGDNEGELHRLVNTHFEKGDSDSALHVALILEGMNLEGAAISWWLHAARLGNRDAIDYVGAYLLPGQECRKAAR